MVILEVTEQRRMNNEYINSWISKLSPVTLAGILKIYSKFLSTLQTKNHQVNHQIFYIAPAYPLSGKSNYVVEAFSAERPACDYFVGPFPHYLRWGGWWGFLANFLSNAPDPIPHLETVQSHFQTEGETW